MRASVDWFRAGNFRSRRGQCGKIAWTRDFSLQDSNGLPMSSRAGFHLRGLRGGLFDLQMKLLAAAREFVGALPIEENSIFAAVQFQRRLAEHVLVLPQFAFELVRARVQLLLLGFHLS